MALTEEPPRLGLFLSAPVMDLPAVLTWEVPANSPGSAG